MLVFGLREVVKEYKLDCTEQRWRLYWAARGSGGICIGADARDSGGNCIGLCVTAAEIALGCA